MLCFAILLCSSFYDSFPSELKHHLEVTHGQFYPFFAFIQFCSETCKSSCILTDDPGNI